VKGGTYYPLSVKKHLRAQEIAEQNNLPCVYLVDSGGANLPNQDEVFPDRDHFGRIFFNQANMSAKGIAADRGGDGLVHGGRRLCAGHVGRDHHRQEPGHDLSRRPAAGEGGHRRGGVSAEDLGGGDVHTRLSGVADHLADDDAHALAWRAGGRQPEPYQGLAMALQTPEDPLYDPEEILGVVPQT
jgi:3-methylcrotonyl-CoA carboxylase beta subunit